MIVSLLGSTTDSSIFLPQFIPQTFTCTFCFRNLMSEDSRHHHPPKIFRDVRFVICGFDPINEPQVMSKLVEGGGVHVGQYGPDCTHVIVDKLLYDDPVCVAARNDGKTLVSGLWVTHSTDMGMAVDPTSIMYRPLKDLKGIPGAQSLVVCLTGYQHQDREDIMTMVSLMGANFLKPLVANKVTHLICYKFEGEKYELAKKMKKIKLVNHMWLEDCLKAWKIFPEVDYCKSGYEMEMLEAEAKDSEEEADVTSKQNQHLNPTQEFKRNHLASGFRSNVINNNNMATATSKEMVSDQVRNQGPNTPKVPGTVVNDLASSGSERGRTSNCLKTPPKGPVLSHEEKTSTSDAKRKLDVSCGSSNSTKINDKLKARKLAGGLWETNRSELLEPASLASGPTETSDHLFSNNEIHYSSATAALSPPRRSSARTSNLMSSSVDRKSPKSCTLVSKDVNSDSKVEGALQNYCSASKEVCQQSKPKNEDVINRLEHATDEVLKVSSPRNDRLEVEKSNGSSSLSLGTDAFFKQPSRKTYVRKSRGKNNMTNLKGSIYLNKSVSGDDPAISVIKMEGTAGHQNFERVPPAVTHTDLGAATHDISQSRYEGQEKSILMDDETEAPEDEGDKVRIAVSEEKYREDDTYTHTKPRDLETKENDDDALRVHNDTAISGKDKDWTAQQKVICDKKKLGESTNMQKAVKENTSKGRKLSSSKLKKDTVPSNPPENKEVPEAGNEENYVEVEAKNVGKTVEVCKRKTSGGDIDGTKQKKVTCSKRKLEESTHIVKAVKEKISRGKPPSKIKKMMIPSETPDEENEVPEAPCAENNGEAELDVVGNLGAEEKSEVMQTYKTDSNAVGVHDHKLSGRNEDFAKQKNTTCGKRKLGESSDTKNAVKNINAAEKYPSAKVKRGKVAAYEEAGSEKNEAEFVKEVDKSVEIEQENMLVCAGDQNVSHGKNLVAKLAPKNASRKIVTNATTSRLQVQTALKPEPVWFILSGHKLQIKEFQKVIKQLKGRVCRDSHQWSYQATHFVVPDPIRRTEKFFAAAASGRWILKTDYLSDSSQAGKLLAEEPYEWHMSGLSEDGAINLEAPRKWRLHREKTGHGAFYGMNIIIYGDCIAPSLDTLKRVVRAGDGTILATSPPYTRFLEAGVDFAVASPGMPHVDMWVQEFLRHEIPCIVADYLVEFVCKPDYSLERHVQYNTHMWAEKSFTNLMNRSESIVGLMTTRPGDGGDNVILSREIPAPSDCGGSDLPCQVCGSHDKREKMLICGNESGSTGCGVGMHIDCCNPPLPDIPKEGWFFPKCSESRSSSKKPPKNSKKRTPSSKRK